MSIEAQKIEINERFGAFAVILSIRRYIGWLQIYMANDYSRWRRKKSKLKRERQIKIHARFCSLVGICDYTAGYYGTSRTGRL